MMHPLRLLDLYSHCFCPSQAYVQMMFEESVVLKVRCSAFKVYYNSSSKNTLMGQASPSLKRALELASKWGVSNWFTVFLCRKMGLLQLRRVVPVGVCTYYVR